MRILKSIKQGQDFLNLQIFYIILAGKARWIELRSFIFYLRYRPSYYECHQGKNLQNATQGYT